MKLITYLFLLLLFHLCVVQIQLLEKDSGYDEYIVIQRNKEFTSFLCIATAYISKCVKFISQGDITASWSVFGKSIPNQMACKYHRLQR